MRKLWALTAIVLLGGLAVGAVALARGGGGREFDAKLDG